SFISNWVPMPDLRLYLGDSPEILNKVDASSEIEIAEKRSFQSATDSANLPVNTKGFDRTIRFYIGASLLLVWALGVVFLLIREVIRLMQIYWRLLKTSMVLVESDQLDGFAELRGKVYATTGIDFPAAVIGFGRSRIIVIHQSFIEGRHREEDLRAVLQHEWSHYKNRDDLWGIVIFCLRTIFWFNPLVYSFVNSVWLAIEIRCDLEVTQKISTKSYGVALLYIARKFESSEVFRPGYQSVGQHIQKRISVVCQEPSTSKGVLKNVAKASLLGAMVGLALLTLFPTVDNRAVQLFKVDSIQKIEDDSQYRLAARDNRISLGDINNGQLEWKDGSPLVIQLSHGCELSIECLSSDAESEKVATDRDWIKIGGKGQYPKQLRFSLNGTADILLRNSMRSDELRTRGLGIHETIELSSPDGLGWYLSSDEPDLLKNVVGLGERKVAFSGSVVPQRANWVAEIFRTSEWTVTYQSSDEEEAGQNYEYCRIYLRNFIAD
ncbi:MAG: M56 family metallopeptidase, partial [Verrucomicrobiota bacterium]